MAALAEMGKRLAACCFIGLVRSLAALSSLAAAVQRARLLRVP